MARGEQEPARGQRVQPRRASAAPATAQDDLHVCPSLRLRARLPHRLGARGRPSLERGPSLPRLRVARQRHLRRRPSSTASTRSSTTAPRSCSTISTSSPAPTWRSRATRFVAALAATRSFPRTSSRSGCEPRARRPRRRRPLRRSARRRRRRPARAALAAPPRAAPRRARLRALERARPSARTSSSAPVAAIRSQIASAWRSAEAAKLEPGQRRVDARGRGSAAGSRCRRAGRCRAPCRCARAGR